MRPGARLAVFALGVLSLAIPAMSAAQPLGSFTWQLQPFCNRVTVNVRQDGAVYTLDGFDDQCGAGQRAPLTGLATPNPDGTIGLGFNVVTVPGGAPVAIDARIPFPALTGTWQDSAGNTGVFAFSTNTGGNRRPAPAPAATGDITAVTAGSGLTGGGTSGAVSLAVDPAAVQSRVTTACPAGQALRSIAQDGTAECETIPAGAGGDITAVNPGVGLFGGGSTGDVALAVLFGGTGTLNEAARSDHNHGLGVKQSSTAVGIGALSELSTGAFDAAFGIGALANTTTGSSNVAVGPSALFGNQVGNANVAVGRSALSSSTASQNTAVGFFTLDAATTGGANTAVGSQALFNLTTGAGNVALGTAAGLNLTTGTRSVVIGDHAEVGAGAQTNATAVGANAVVTQDNSMVLGSIAGFNDSVASTRVGIGTTAPGALLDITDDTTTGGDSLQVTRFANSGSGPTITFRKTRGSRAVPSGVLANDNLLFLRATGHNGSAISSTGRATIFAEATEDWTTTANGARWAFFTTTGGTTATSERLRIDHDGEVGIGTTDPQALLHVAGTVQVAGVVRVDTLGAAGATTLCRNAGNQIATCSSSLRYKRDVRAFDGGLTLLGRLRPISFTWTDGGMADVGFGAEDVAAIDPRFAVLNEDGTVEGVKYDRLTAVLVNAVRELDMRNLALEKQNAALERRLAALEAAPAGRRD